jgi:hypothetical protein
VTLKETGLKYRKEAKIDNEGSKNMSFQSGQNTKPVPSAFVRSRGDEVKNIFISHITEEQEVAAAVN